MEHVPSLHVAIVGLGNLAWSLIPNLQGAGVTVKQVFSRKAETVFHYCKSWNIDEGSTNLKDLDPNLDLVLLTVGDDAIAPVVEALASKCSDRTVFAHTSGSTSIEVLAPLGERTGVFYPMQTFTRDRVADYQEIPIFLEGSESTLQLLRDVASKLSNRVYILDSAGRMRLHIGAVFACNFTNYLFRMADRQLPQAAGWDFRIYEPLVREHIDKVFHFMPEHTQTGPAVRGDQRTVDKHLRHLADLPELQELYRQLSRSINPELD